MKASITTELVRQLRRQPPAQALDIWDTQSKLVLRVRPSGQHSYLVLLGRGRWFTLGTIDDLTPADARKLALRRLSDVAFGLEPARNKETAEPTVSEFLRQTYEPWLVANRKHGKVIADHIDKVFEGCIGPKRLSEVAPWDVERWRTLRLKQKVTPATANRDLSALRALFNRAVSWGHLAVSPMTNVKALPEDKTGFVRYLSAAETTRLFEALAARDTRRRVARERANQWRRVRNYPEWPPYTSYTDHLTPLVILALNTGLRFGELTALRWHDVDMAQRLLTVVKHNAKSGRARHVPLNSDAYKAIVAWRPASADDYAFVFPGIAGARITDVKTAWKEVLSEAKIDRFRFHDLRHSFASNLAMAEIDLNTVRELLGHSDLTMTLRYAHLAPQHTAAAVEKLVRMTDKAAGGTLTGATGSGARLL
jgi:integrase